MNCTRCAQPLRVLALAGHYGRQVEIDLCAPCHLVWFDDVEAAQIAGPGLLALVGEMAAAQTLAHTAPGRDAEPPCPRCGAAVRLVHNPTRWGRAMQLQCTQRHGAWQTFAQFLAQRGLLRPMTLPDRHRAGQHEGGLCCVNCGGAIGLHDEACTWCRSVPALLDVARLARALDPDGATEGHAVHRQAAKGGALNCLACGVAVEEPGAWRCAACGATLGTPRLAEAHRQVSALAPALQAHARKPAAHVVQRRLDAQAGAIQRQRERAQQMQREADTRMGRVDDGPDDLAGWFFEKVFERLF